MRARATFVALTLFALGLTGLAGAEVVQRGQLRVAFDVKLTPHALPRSGVAPVRVTFGGTISTLNGAKAPQLRRISIAVNRYGRFAPGALPVCHLEEIQPATTTGALEACRDSLVGEGRFSAEVLLPEQAPFPSKGEVIAFNGTFHGKPAILAHVYGTEPVPTSFTLPFQIEPIKGTYGTLLSASLPEVTSEWGFVTGLSLVLDRTITHHGRKLGYISAGCPAPEGFPGAVFPLARSSFVFAGGSNMTKVLNRTCKVRR
jgi:hypothetical protein